MTRVAQIALAALVAAQAPQAAGPAPEALRIRATPAFAPCAAALRDAFSASRALPVSLDVADAPGIAGADLLLADYSELTRILEGGLGDARTAVNLGDVPWVALTPADEPAAPGLTAFAASAGPVGVLGGLAGREARAALALPPARLAVSRDPAELRAARYALVPRSLAGPGRQAVVEDIPPLAAVAVAVNGSPHAADARSFLDFLRRGEARRIFEACGGVPRSADGDRPSKAAAGHAQAVVDWWVPGCSQMHNAYNDPATVLGPPDAENVGGKDEYRGMMSLGQGGWVVVDMGQPVVDGLGADVRVYQTVSGEPVTLYAADTPVGPFRLVQLMRPCGIPTRGVFSNHCDFDLAKSAIPSARYFRVEDGEIYPCLAGDTVTEGADIDSIESLRP